MSELAQPLKTLRGTITQAELAARSGISLRTIQRGELGHSISLSTLRALAAHFRLKRGDYAFLLLLWVRDALGPDRDLLEMKLANATERRGDVENFFEVFRALSAPHQRELMRASLSPETLRALSALNDAFSKLEAGSRKDVAD